MARFQILLRVLHAAIFEDWLLKFICLAFATMMWIYIDGELTGEMDVPLLLRKGDFTLPPNLEMPEQEMPRYTVHATNWRRSTADVDAVPRGMEGPMATA